MSSIDVIVPCYKYGHFLEACVQSVLEQSMTDVRILILDDASPDDTAQVSRALAGRDSRVSVVRHETNRGHITTYNEGLDWASAEFSLLLSADDYLLPGSLERALGLMTANPEIGLVFGNVVELNEQGQARYVSVLDLKHGETGCAVFSGEEFIRLSGPNNLVSTPTAIVRTEVQKAVGGYRHELPHSGDMEMWLRFAARAPVGFIETPQAVYRRHAQNMSLSYLNRHRLSDLQQRERALEVFFSTAGRSLRNVQSLRQEILCELAMVAIGYASSAFNEGDIDNAQRISVYAQGLNPAVSRSWPGFKLACKYALGPRNWAAARSAIAGLRGGE